MCPSYWGLAALWRDRACAPPIGGWLLCEETEHVSLLLGAGCFVERQNMCPSSWGLAALWRDRTYVHPIGGWLLCEETEHMSILLGAGCYRQEAVLGSDL